MNQHGQENKRERNRKEMPNVAEIIDQMTEFFGPVRVIGAEDYITKKKVGNLDDPAPTRS